MKAVGVAVMIAGAVVGGLVVVLLVLEWRPPAVVTTPVEPPARPAPEEVAAPVAAGGRPGAAGAAVEIPPSHLSILTWNLGYAGLDAGADFFMDGGTEVRPAGAGLVARNLAALADYIRTHPADVVFLQEVDRSSSRSFHIDEAAALAAALPGDSHSYAPNFRTAWIPYPFLHPLGKVESGLLTFSRYPPAGAWRRQLPGRFPWPVRVFHLKRCLHELRLPAPDGRDWVLINLHLSTFDRGGRIRRQELAYLKDLLLRYQGQGDHVIVGGDWNEAFPGVKERLFPASSPTPDWYEAIPADWTPPGWTWAYDRSTPSLRATDRPYRAGVNFLTVIDGFLVGPDIKVQSVRTDDLGFAHSDHHPVRCEVALATER